MSFKSFLFPNYSLLAMASLMIMTAVILNWVYVPDTETLFVAFFFWEFCAVFFTVLSLVMLYDFRCPQENRSVIKIYYSLMGFLLIYVILTLFSTMKSIIHVVQPVNIDEWLIQIEQILHFGFLPTTLVDDSMRFGGFYRLMDFTYLLWFFWMYIYLSLVMLSEPFSRMRERYLFCFAGVFFFIGNIAAGLMASAGPVFLEDFFKPETSSAALNTLRASADQYEAFAESKKHFAFAFQDLIMEYRSNKTMVDPNGVSAMPSVHVAIAALMMFHARHVNRLIFALSILFFACIFIGSVLLCWHYAVDGYVAALLTFGLWKLSAFLPSPEKPQNSAA